MKLMAHSEVLPTIFRMAALADPQVQHWGVWVLASLTRDRTSGAQRRL